MRSGPLLGLGSIVVPAAVVVVGWASGCAALPTTIDLSGNVSEWVLAEDWTMLSLVVVGAFLGAEVVAGSMYAATPIALASRIPWSTYWLSTPEREDRLRELLRASNWAVMAWFNAVLAGYLTLTVVAAVLGVSSLGYAVPVLVGVGGTMTVALLAYDVLVRYRPPEET